MRVFSFTTRLYPITDVRISGLSQAEQVARFSAGGATLIQLREKYLSAREFYGDAEAALRVAHSRGARLIINDRVDIALALHADGVHLGQDDLSPSVARQLLGEVALIGLSTHNVEQAHAAANMPVDYIAIGPIFSTATKADPDPVVGLDGLRRVREVIGGLPLVAIGGITAQNASQVISAGADAVAVVSNLLTDPPRIQERTMDFQSGF
jgi:thiamine-phosphate pyrophosphorylase